MHHNGKNIMIGNLPDAETLDGTEYIAIMQNGVEVKVPLYKVLNLTPPAISTPVTLTATVVDSYEIDLSWTGDTGGPDAYILERCRENDGAWVGIYSGTDTSYTDTDLYPEETYYYRIQITESGLLPSDWAFANATTDFLP